MKVHFAAQEETSDEPGVNEARGFACEYVAWQFLTNLSERESIEYLLHELAPASSSDTESTQGRQDYQNGNAHEVTPLLGSSLNPRSSSYFGTDSAHGTSTAPTIRSDDFCAKFENLSALEIAAVSGSKKFMSQRPVQRIINGVWRVGTSALDLRNGPTNLEGRVTLCSGRP